MVWWIKQALFQSKNVPNLFADRLVNHWTKTLTEYLIIPIYEINMLGIWCTAELDSQTLRYYIVLSVISVNPVQHYMTGKCTKSLFPSITWSKRLITVQTTSLMVWWNTRLEAQLMNIKACSPRYKACRLRYLFPHRCQSVSFSVYCFISL